VMERIETAIINSSSQTDLAHPEDKSLSDLIGYLLDKHHVFTTQEIARLTPLMAKVEDRHGQLHTELIELKVLFTSLADSLRPHMRKEEVVLFPYILQLESAASAGVSAPPAHFGTVENPVRMLMSEHDTDGDRLRQMRELTNDYTLPKGACPSFTALYAGLEDLERDLHRHIHLENNVLFPAAVELEQRLLLAH
jgi:regulator of cell morphogenesis and NO signaling